MKLHPKRLLRPDVRPGKLDPSVPRLFVVGPHWIQASDRPLRLCKGCRRTVAPESRGAQWALALTNHSGVMAEAEEAALRFTDQLDELLGRSRRTRSVVWMLSSWGATPTGVSPAELPEFQNLVDPTGESKPDLDQQPVLARVLANAKHRKTLTTSRKKALLDAYLDVWAAGIGLRSVQDAHLVLTLNIEPVHLDWRQYRRVYHEYAVWKAAKDLDIEALAGLLPARVPLSRNLLKEVLRYSHPLGERLEDAVRVVAAHGADWSDALPSIVRWALHRPGQLALLVRAGLALDQRDAKGRAAVHFAETHQHLETLASLGFDLHAVDTQGWSALHYARFRDWSGLCGALEAAGLSTTAETSFGQRPSEMRPLHKAPRPRRNHPTERYVHSVPSELQDGLVDQDPEVWRVFSDWLLERGDPRGTTIQLSLSGQVDLAEAHNRAHPAAWHALTAQSPAWTRPGWAGRLPIQFKYGFPVNIEATPKYLKALTPTRLCGELLHSPTGMFVQRLRLDIEEDDDFRELWSSQPTSLRTLDLRGCKPRAYYLDKCRFPNLRTLSLSGTSGLHVHLESGGLRTLILAQTRSSSVFPLQVSGTLAGLRHLAIGCGHPDLLTQMDWLDLLPHTLSCLALHNTHAMGLETCLRHPVVRNLDTLFLHGLDKRATDVVASASLPDTMRIHATVRQSSDHAQYSALLRLNSTLRRRNPHSRAGQTHHTIPGIWRPPTDRHHAPYFTTRFREG